MCVCVCRWPRAAAQIHYELLREKISVSTHRVGLFVVLRLVFISAVQKYMIEFVGVCVDGLFGNDSLSRRLRNMDGVVDR